MLKDYYKILGISKYASAQEIKSAYRTMSMKWHPDKNPGIDVTSVMQDINEAYTILKDENKRERYNKEYDTFFAQLPNTSKKYDYNIKDDTLKNDIANARKYAKDLVDEFLKSFNETSKEAVKGAAKSSFQYAVAWIIAGFILATLTVIIRSCNS